MRYPTAYGTTMREGSYDVYHNRFEPACSEPADLAVLLDATERFVTDAPRLGISAQAGAG